MSGDWHISWTTSQACGAHVIDVQVTDPMTAESDEHRVWTEPNSSE